ncbi:MAG TPA: hypothetical protein VFD32_08205 [Dehalococcoidia bacterium]|nr:hypothetical protein [Dehalococcoidia bacterium]
MHQRILLLAEASAGPEAFQACRSLAGQFAATVGEPVGVALLPKTRMQLVRATLQAAGGDRYVEELPPRASATPMGSARFVYREDGRPDWAEMWTSFCELALYGGPPHRGEDTTLHAPQQPGLTPQDGFDAIAEIRRGVWETTGLFAEPAAPGWIVVRCSSRKMAAWLCATIILENVEARCEEERLFLPASPDFALENEVKSVITVLAKTCHYWQAHLTAQTAATAAG